MKSRINKILSVVVVLATLASLLISTTLPASAAAPGALAWTVTASPSAVGNLLTSGVSINKVAAAADGKTVFAWDGTVNKLYKSTNGGASWGAGVTVAAASAVVALEVSPNFAADATVALADATEVFLSTNGGTSFASVILDLVAQLEAGAITSMDVGNFFSSPTTVSILLGVSGGAGAKSNVLMWTMGGFSWAEVGGMTLAGIGVAQPAAVPPTLAFDPQVKAVMFSPAHTTDAEIMAVYVDAVNNQTLLGSHYGAVTLAFNAFIPPLQIVASGATTNAAIGVGSDYVGNTGSAILVSIYGTGLAAGNDNIWKVTGRAAAAGTATNLLVGGTATNVSVQQIVVSGTTAAGTVVYTMAGSNLVKRATGGTATFTAATVSKQPAGATQAFVALGGTTFFASVSGADGGVSRSTDGGVSFDGVGLIDVGTIANMSLVDLAIVDANTMFVVMNNATGGYTARSVFKTTDAGATWVRIRNSAGAVKVLVSPAYATDSTLVILEGTTLTMKSTNGGATFTSFGIPTNAVVGLMVDGNNFFAGGGTAGEFFKSGRFAAATFPTGFAATITSVALNPKDATKATIAVGCDNATVYQSTNDGVTFTKVTGATVNPTGANAMVAYGPDGTLYCSTTTGFGSYIGTDWISLGTAGTNLVLSTDNTLYVSSSTAGASVYRSLKPTAATATKAEVQQLNYTAANYPAAAAAIDVHVLSGAAANSIYILDNAVTQTSYGFAGGIYGFSDTLISAAAITAPKSGVVAGTASTTLSWPAITGATDYKVTFDAVEGLALGNVLTTGSGTVAEGSTHTWSVRAVAPLYSRASATATFIMALTQPTVVIAQNPTQGATDVPVDTTFTWPPSTVAGTTYEFAIAEELGNADKFAIIDYSVSSITNAHKLQELLKYNTQYWWRVRTVTGSSASAWTVSTFVTEKEPVVTTATAPVTPTYILPTVTVTNTPIVITTNPTPQPAIPSYLLWAVIAVGAILVIAVIVLIVRTRRIS